MYKTVLNGSNSAVCNNVNFVTRFLNIPKYDMLNVKSHTLCTMIDNIYKPFKEEEITASQIRDLLTLRNNRVNNFTRADINQMLNYLCTT